MPSSSSEAPSFDRQREARSRAVLLGLPPAFAQSLKQDAQAFGHASSIAEAPGGITGSDDASLLLIIDLDAPRALELVTELRGRFPRADIVPITSISCVHKIAEAVRHGASTVLARPTNFAQICAALTQQAVPRSQLEPMSYDRAVWEYLNQVVVEAGSIAGAARRLRLDRTSLKRKLRKVPPR